MFSVSKIVNNRNGAFKSFDCNILRVPKRHERAWNLERIGRISANLAEKRDNLSVLRVSLPVVAEIGHARVGVAQRIIRYGSPSGPLPACEALSRHASRYDRRSCVRRRIRRPREATALGMAGRVAGVAWELRQFASAGSNPPPNPSTTRLSRKFQQNFDRQNFEIFASQRNSAVDLQPSIRVASRQSFETFGKLSTAKFSRKFCNLATIFGNLAGIAAVVLD